MKLMELKVEVLVPDDEPRSYYEGLDQEWIWAEVYDALAELESEMDYPRISLVTFRRKNGEWTSK